MSVDIIASKLPADNRYGQNGFQKPSSDLPGSKTTSGFLPECKLPAEGSDGQTRTVSAEPFKTSWMHRDANESNAKIGGTLTRNRANFVQRKPL